MSAIVKNCDELANLSIRYGHLKKSQLLTDNLMKEVFFDTMELLCVTTDLSELDPFESMDLFNLLRDYIEEHFYNELSLDKYSKSRVVFEMERLFNNWEGVMLFSSL